MTPGTAALCVAGGEAAARRDLVELTELSGRGSEQWFNISSSTETRRQMDPAGGELRVHFASPTRYR
jgi:hypothetical protein